MSLQETLGAKLDAQHLIDGLLGDLTGPAGQLGATQPPVDDARLTATTSGADHLDASAIGAAAARLAERAAPLLANLPGVGDVLGPLTAAIELAEQAASGQLADSVRALIAQLGRELGGASDGGLMAALLRGVEALGATPEGAPLREVVQAALRAFKLDLPQLPVGDTLRAVDGSVRSIGGMMALETVLAEAERLTGAMRAQVDGARLRGQLAAVQAALDGNGTSLPDFVAAVDAADPAAVDAALQASQAVAGQLDGFVQSLATGLGLGEATLVYLDVDQVQLETAAAAALVRSADLDPLRRTLGPLGDKLRPLVSRDLGAAAATSVDAAIAAAEGKVAELAQQIAAVDVAGLVRPVSSGLDSVAHFIGQVSDVIARVVVSFQSAMNTVRDAVAALPIHDIVDALQTVLQPIADLLDKIRELVDGIESTLGEVAKDTHLAIDAVGGVLDGFKHEIDTLFGGAKELVEKLDLDQVIGAVSDNLRAFGEVLAKAQMKPYFDTADEVISTTADVISVLPFGLLPDSMKQKVDDALEPIREVDAEAVQAEIESLLQIGPDHKFALRPVLEQAIHEVQVKYDALLDTIKSYDPHKYLAQLDEKLHGIAQKIHEFSPALTLQPVRDAVDKVKDAIVGFDLEKQLEPVHAVFAQIVAKLDELNPTRFVAPIEQKLTEAREKVVAAIKLRQWRPAIDQVIARGNQLLGAIDPARLGAQLQRILEDALAELGLPSLKIGAGLGSILVALANGLGLRLSAGAFDVVRSWLGGASGSTALSGRAQRIADAVVGTRTDVASLELSTLGAGVVTRTRQLVPALRALAARLPDGDARRAPLGAAGDRLDAEARLGALESNRTRFLATLDHSAELAEALRRGGFSEVDVTAGNFRAALQPLAPARDFLRRLLSLVGLGAGELSLPGVVRALFAVAPPARIVAIAQPLFTALRDRILTLVNAIATPVKDGIANLEHLVDEIDLKPLTDAIDGVFQEVKTQIEALDPVHILKAPLDAFNKLKDDLRTKDPLAQVIEIITNLRDALTALVAKLDSNKLLETPLAIYDHILGELGKLKLDGLLDPVFTQLDAIAAQVDEGLTNTVAAFEKLQEALPGGDGGGSASASVSVG